MTRTLAAAAVALCLASSARAQQPQYPIKTVLQQPDEELVYSCDGSPQYGDTIAVSSLSATVTKKSGTDAICSPAAAIMTTLPPTGTLAPVRIAPVGRHGCDFALHILATMANTQKIACDALIQVRKAVPQ